MQTERLKWKTYFSLRCYSPFIPLDVAKVSFNQLGAGNMDWGLRGMICCWEVMIDSEGITSMSVLGQGDGAGAWEHLQRLQTELEVKHRDWIEEEDKQALFPNPAKILWRLRWAQCPLLWSAGGAAWDLEHQENPPLWVKSLKLWWRWGHWTNCPSARIPTTSCTTASRAPHRLTQEICHKTHRQPLQYREASARHYLRK